MIWKLQPGTLLNVSVVVSVTATACLAEQNAWMSNGITAYGVGGDAGQILYKIDLSTGSIFDQVHLAESVEDIEGLAYNRETKKLYGADDQKNGLWEINTTSGEVTSIIDHFGFNSHSDGLCFCGDENVLFMVDAGHADDNRFHRGLYAIDVSTGTIQRIGGPYDASLEIDALACLGNMLYGIDGRSGELVTIDRNDGSVSSVGSLGLGADLGDNTGLTTGNKEGAESLYMVRKKSEVIYKVDNNSGNTTVCCVVAGGNPELSCLEIVLDDATDVTDDVGIQPSTFHLDQNYPNPFNPSTTVRFSLAEKTSVNLKVYNIVGELVTELVDEDFSPGEHSVTWTGRDATNRPVASGVYFCQMVAGEYRASRKMLLLR